jgi:hypothetical protein
VRKRQQQNEPNLTKDLIKNTATQPEKTDFSIKNQQDYNRSMDVTALPPSFLFGMKI